MDPGSMFFCVFFFGFRVIPRRKYLHLHIVQQKQRRKAEEKQAAERGHSASTASNLYDTGMLGEEKERWTPGTTRKQPSDYEPIQEMSEVELDRVELVVSNTNSPIPAQEDKGHKRKRKSRWGPGAHQLEQPMNPRVKSSECKSLIYRAK